jgi:hypothetical protein
MYHLNAGEFVVQAPQAAIDLHEFSVYPQFILSLQYLALDVSTNPVTVQLLDSNTGNTVASFNFPATVAETSLVVRHIKVSLVSEVPKRLQLKIIAPSDAGVDINAVSFVPGDVIPEFIPEYLVSDSELRNSFAFQEARLAAFNASYNPSNAEVVLDSNPYILSGGIATYDPATNSFVFNIPGIYEISAVIDGLNVPPTTTGTPVPPTTTGTGTPPPVGSIYFDVANGTSLNFTVGTPVNRTFKALGGIAPYASATAPNPIGGPETLASVGLTLSFSGDTFTLSGTPTATFGTGSWNTSWSTNVSTSVSKNTSWSTSKSTSVATSTSWSTSISTTTSWNTTRSTTTSWNTTNGSSWQTSHSTNQSTTTTWNTSRSTTTTWNTSGSTTTSWSTQASTTTSWSTSGNTSISKTTTWTTNKSTTTSWTTSYSTTTTWSTSGTTTWNTTWTTTNP